MCDVSLCLWLIVVRCSLCVVRDWLSAGMWFCCCVSLFVVCRLMIVVVVRSLLLVVGGCAVLLLFDVVCHC